jgi:hypothetical protein
MKRVCRRAAGIAGLLMLSSSVSWALDPGTYTVQCGSPEPPKTERAAYDIKMDLVDLLTLKNSFGAIISGVRLDDGRRVILTGDHGCALIQTRSGSSK